MLFFSTCSLLPSNPSSPPFVYAHIYMYTNAGWWCLRVMWLSPARQMAGRHPHPTGWRSTSTGGQAGTRCCRCGCMCLTWITVVCGFLLHAVLVVSQLACQRVNVASGISSAYFVASASCVLYYFSVHVTAGHHQRSVHTSSSSSSRPASLCSSSSRRRGRRQAGSRFSGGGCTQHAPAGAVRQQHG